MRGLTQLRRYQVQWFNPRPLDGIYAIHPDIRQDNRRLGFAELILVTPDERRALGRDSMSDLCQFTGIPTPIVDSMTQRELEHWNLHEDRTPYRYTFSNGSGFWRPWLH